MLATFDRLADDDLPFDPSEAAAVRAYVYDWAAELDATRATCPARRQEPEHD
jgi:hypothetical protein